MNRNRTQSAEANTMEGKRSPHTIRFFDSEWKRIEGFAEARGLAPAEYVRFATLSAMADGGASVARLAPLIERTFRGTYLLASKLRGEMFEAGEQEALEAILADARDLQQKVQNDASV